MSNRIKRIDRIDANILAALAALYEAVSDQGPVSVQRDAFFQGSWKVFYVYSSKAHP